MSVSKTEVDCRATSLGGSGIQVPVDVLAWVPIPEVEVQVTSKADVVFRIFFFRRKWSPGKCFRFCSITQNSGLHDVHSIETAIATDDLLVLLYDFGRKTWA